MSDSLKHLEDIFPNLARAGYSPTSEKSAVYNCIAFAAGDETRRWAGYRELDYHWPADAIEGHSLGALISAFQSLGYSICDTGALDPDAEKVGSLC